MMSVSETLLEILACPIDKADVVYHKTYDFILCEKCDIRYPAESAGKKEVCAKCGGDVKKIKGEVLICSKCNRWYPVIDDIPHMLPDDLRDDLV